MLSQTTSLCCNLPCMYQKQCRIHGEPIQHRTNEPIGTRNSVRYMVNPCSTGNCCLHTMCQVPKKWMKCYVVCKTPILQLQKYRKFYFSSSVSFHQCCLVFLHLIMERYNNYIVWTCYGHNNIANKGGLRQIFLQDSK